MKKIAIAAAVLLLVTSSGCAIVHRYGEYYGKVIDAETKEPLEGAAVLAVYYTLEYGPAGSNTNYVDAQETVTDNKGEFRIPANWVFTFRPLQSFFPYPLFTIFKPGYGCYPRHKDVKPMLVPNGTLPANEHTQVEIPKIQTKEERIESTHCSPPADMPYAKAQWLIDLINHENKTLGLEIEKYQ